MRNAAKELQLQFWNPRTRAYVPASCFEPAGSEAAKRLAEHGRNAYKVWRMAGPARELKPGRYVRATGARYRHTIEEVRRLYLGWACAKGLKHVHAWKGSLGYSASLTAVDLGGGLRCTFLDPETFHRVEHTEDRPRISAAAAAAGAGAY